MRYRRDIHDDDMLDNLFDREEAQHRRDQRERERAAAIEHGQQLAEAEARQQAIWAENARHYTKRANDLALLREYQKAGVQPPNADADGVPRVSLSMLLWVGWKIEGGVLVAPPPQPKREVQSRKPVKNTKGQK